MKIKPLLISRTCKSCQLIGRNMQPYKNIITIINKEMEKKCKIF